MRKWKVLVIAVAMALVAPATFAQDNVLDELKAMEKRLSALEAENAALRSANATVEDAALEESINALLAGYTAGAVTANGEETSGATIGGELRFRNTWSLGDNAAGVEHEGSYTDSLARLNFGFQLNDNVSAVISYDAHWGFGSGDTAGGSTGITLNQAYVVVDKIFDANLKSTTGRQALNLGTGLQFGDNDWYVGWNFDAMRWDWTSDDNSWMVTGIVSKLTSTDADFNATQTNAALASSHDNDELYALYFQYDGIDQHNIDAYWVYVNGHGGATGGSGVGVGTLGNAAGGAFFHTFGLLIEGNYKDTNGVGFGWSGEFAYQTGGNVAPGSTVDVNGWVLELMADVAFGSGEGKVDVFARFLWASGADGDDSGYIPLYPSRHSNDGLRARYGIFDLMPMANVLSIQGGIVFSANAQWDLGATIIWATQDEGVGGADSEDYGWEIDFWVEYSLNKAVTYGGGVAIFFPDDNNLFVAGADDDTQFMLYIQIRVLF